MKFCLGAVGTVTSPSVPASTSAAEPLVEHGTSARVRHVFSTGVLVPPQVDSGSMGIWV